MYVIHASRYVISICLTLRCNTHCRYNLHIVTCMYIYIYIYLRFRLPRVTRRRRAVVARHSSIISCIVVAARELSAGGFVGKPNVSECARAYVWPRVSRVHVRRTKTRAAAEGARGMTVTCAEDLLRFTRGIPRSVCHPCPRPCPRRPATVPSPLVAAHPSASSPPPPPLVLFSYSPSILVILRRVTPLSFRRWSKNKVPDSRCMNDNLIAGGLKSWKRFTSEYWTAVCRVSRVPYITRFLSVLG